MACHDESGGRFQPRRGPGSPSRPACDQRSARKNGEVVRRFAPANRREGDGYASALTFEHRPRRSGWIAWRCFERRPDNRLRFAHTAPWHVTVPGRPLLPRREQIDWLVASVQTEIERTRPVAPRSLIEDYERALKIYEEIAARVR